MPICAAIVRANFHGPFRLNPTDMATSKGVPSLRRLRTFARHHEPIVPAGNQNRGKRTADRRSARLPGQWPAETPDPVRWESPTDVCRPIFWEFPNEEPVKSRNCRTVAIDEYQATSWTLPSVALACGEPCASFCLRTVPHGSARAFG
jgi:hypothetical protein